MSYALGLPGRALREGAGGWTNASAGRRLMPGISRGASSCVLRLAARNTFRAKTSRTVLRQCTTLNPVLQIDE